MDAATVRAMLERHFEYAESDPDAAHDMYHEDAVLEFPQSGERFADREPPRVERDTTVEFREVRGRGDVWIAGSRSAMTTVLRCSESASSSSRGRSLASRSTSPRAGSARVARAVEVRAVATTTGRVQLGPALPDSPAARIASAGSRCGRRTNEPGLGGCQRDRRGRGVRRCCGWRGAARGTSASRARFVSTMRRSSSSASPTPCCLRSWSSRRTRATTTRSRARKPRPRRSYSCRAPWRHSHRRRSSASRAYWSATAAR